METSDDKRQHSAVALILLVLDLFLATCMFLELGFVVPVCQDMFRDFGQKLPTPTQVVINISNTIMVFHGIVFGILLCFALWRIIRMYFVLHRRGDRKKLFTFLWIIFFSFVLIMGMITLTMFLPVFKMCGQIGG